MESWDINFMILTELKETVYSFLKDRNEYHQIARFVNLLTIKSAGTATGGMVAMALLLKDGNE
jgi:hypothetical protein